MTSRIFKSISAGCHFTDVIRCQIFCLIYDGISLVFSLGFLMLPVIVFLLSEMVVQKCSPWSAA